MANIEIKNIIADKSKVIEPEWREKVVERFPKAAQVKDENLYDFLYGIAAPYDEEWYLQVCLNFDEEQMKDVYAARDFIKHFIVSIERYDNYTGPGNHL